jgi:hypothetical protein
MMIQSNANLLPSQAESWTRAAAQLLDGLIARLLKGRMTG